MKPLGPGDTRDGDHRTRLRHRERTCGDDPAERTERAADREDARAVGAERPRHPCNAALLAGSHEQTISHRRRLERFTQPARGQESLRQIVLADGQQIDVAFELDMLKPVVEQVERRPETILGHATGPLAVAPDQHRHAGQRARQHQRFVAGVVEIREDTRAIGDDRDLVARHAPGVAATEDGGAFAAIEKQARDVGHERRLSAAPDAQVANAHHRSRQPASASRIRPVPSAPPSCRRAVHRAGRAQDHPRVALRRRIVLRSSNFVVLTSAGLVGSAERPDVASSPRQRQQFREDGQCLVLRAPVGLDQRAGGCAQPGLTHRIGKERQQRLFELAF